MSYNPQNPNGQATSANSAPVVIASDQSALPVSLSGGSTSANQTNGTQQTKLTDGTNTVGVLAPGTANSSANALLAGSTSFSATFSVTAAGAGTAYDVGNYRWVSVQITSQFSGTTVAIGFQCSNDGINWYNSNLFNAGGGATQGATSTGSTGINTGSLMGRYFRLNFTGTYSSGTAAGTIVFSSLAGAHPSAGISGVITPGNLTGAALPTGSYYMGVSDGTNLQGVVEATTAANTTGVGLLGVGTLAFDGSKWQSTGSVDGDTGYNGMATGAASKTYTFTTSTAGAQTILANTLTEGFSTIEVVFTSVGSGLALNGQWSNASGGTYVNGTDFGNSTNVPVALGTTVSTIYSSPVRGNYFQIAVSALTSGTFAGWIRLTNASPIYGKPSTSAIQSGTWTTTPSNANYQVSGSITSASSSLATATESGYGGFATLSVSGTYAGVSFAITESDNSGTTLFNVPVYNTTTNQWLAPGATITPGTNASVIYYVPVFPNTAVIKAAASAWTSGTATLRWSLGANNMPSSLMSAIWDSAGNNRGANVDTNNALLVDPGAATAATAPALAMEQGGIASTSLPTATTNGQLTGLMSDKFGRPVVLSQATRDIVGQQATTITASTASTTVVTAIASTYTDITSISLVNSGASSTLITLSDGTNSYYFYAPSGDMRGAVYQVPLPATNVNTNWTVTCGTSTSSLYVTIEYIKNK